MFQLKIRGETNKLIFYKKQTHIEWLDWEPGFNKRRVMITNGPHWLLTDMLFVAVRAHRWCSTEMLPAEVANLHALS